MERENNAICPYLKGGTEGAVCTLMDCPVREIRFTDIKQCFGGHAVCKVYRRYGGVISEPDACL